jgi:hypothetical protein
MRHKLTSASGKSGYERVVNIRSRAKGESAQLYFFAFDFLYGSEEFWIAIAAFMGEGERVGMGSARVPERKMLKLQIWMAELCVALFSQEMLWGRSCEKKTPDNIRRTDVCFNIQWTWLEMKIRNHYYIADYWLHNLNLMAKWFIWSHSIILPIWSQANCVPVKSVDHHKERFGQNSKFNSKV